jgi:AcrR family transcriptional regulator
MSRPTAPSSPSPFPTPSDAEKKSDRTRAEILNSALEFLWSNRFRDMTVAAVMAPTSAGRSAFYQYFEDLQDLMATLLEELREEIVAGVQPWLAGDGDPVGLLRDSLRELVRVCHHYGPVLQAITDAAPTDEQLEEAWTTFMSGWDDVVTARIEADQAQGLIPAFQARPVAVALNRMDAHTLIHAFGRRPRAPQEPVYEAIARVWVGALYGSTSNSRRTREEAG